jgi:hypothetical protein
MVIERRKKTADAQWEVLSVEKTILEISDTVFGDIDDKISPIEYCRFCLGVALKIIYNHKYETNFAEYRMLGVTYDRCAPRSW